MIDLNDTALPRIPSKCRVTLLALGDVGSTLLMGLRLMGGDVIAPSASATCAPAFLTAGSSS